VFGVKKLLEPMFQFLGLARSQVIRKSIEKNDSRNKINGMFNGTNGGFSGACNKYIFKGYE
jgi:hypothetical protein